MLRWWQTAYYMSESVAQLNKILVQCTTLCMTWVSSCWSWCSCERFPNGNFCIPTNKLSHSPKVLIVSDSRYTLTVTCQHLTREAHCSLLKLDPATVHLSHHSPPLQCTYFCADRKTSSQEYIYSVGEIKCRYILSHSKNLSQCINNSYAMSRKYLSLLIELLEIVSTLLRGTITFVDGKLRVLVEIQVYNVGKAENTCRYVRLSDI